MFKWLKKIFNMIRRRLMEYLTGTQEFSIRIPLSGYKLIKTNIGTISDGDTSIGIITGSAKKKDYPLTLIYTLESTESDVSPEVLMQNHSDKTVKPQGEDVTFEMHKGIKYSPSKGSTVERSTPITLDSPSGVANMEQVSETRITYASVDGLTFTSLDTSNDPATGVAHIDSNLTTADVTETAVFKWSDGSSTNFQYIKKSAGVLPQTVTLNVPNKITINSSTAANSSIGTCTLTIDPEYSKSLVYSSGKFSTINSNLKVVGKITTSGELRGDIQIVDPTKIQESDNSALLATIEFTYTKNDGTSETVSEDTSIVKESTSAKVTISGLTSGCKAQILDSSNNVIGSADSSNTSITIPESNFSDATTAKEFTLRMWYDNIDISGLKAFSVSPKMLIFNEIGETHDITINSGDVQVPAIAEKSQTISIKRGETITIQNTIDPTNLVPACYGFSSIGGGFALQYVSGNTNYPFGARLQCKILPVQDTTESYTVNCELYYKSSKAKVTTSSAYTKTYLINVTVSGSK